MKRNRTPVAPFSLRERGPQSEASLKKTLGEFRYARGVGADRRATVDPSPCPDCGGKVEWALTYRRQGAVIVPYVYARCRTAPKAHRWDFTHWKAPVRSAQRKAPVPAPRPSIPDPRPSVGADLMGAWIEKRIDTLSTELDRLTKIRTLAAEVTGRPIGAHHNGHH